MLEGARKDGSLTEEGKKKEKKKMTKADARKMQEALQRGIDKVEAKEKETTRQVLSDMIRKDEAIAKINRKIKDRKILMEAAKILDRKFNEECGNITACNSSKDIETQYKAGKHSALAQMYLGAAGEVKVIAEHYL